MQHTKHAKRREIVFPFAEMKFTENDTTLRDCKTRRTNTILKEQQIFKESSQTRLTNQPKMRLQEPRRAYRVFLSHATIVSRNRSGVKTENGMKVGGVRVVFKAFCRWYKLGCWTSYGWLTSIGSKPIRRENSINGPSEV